ncbi:MAG: hypothetical protein MAG431_01085 [Chloroflexi bacterium]|nr:hypothetical protein [Chloroflexota bacterium]
MILEIDTPEPSNPVQKILWENAIQIYSLDGFSVKEDKVTGLFERRLSQVEIDKVTPALVKEHIAQNSQAWKAKIGLADCLKIPLHLIIYEHDQDCYKMFRLLLAGQIIKIKLMDTLTCQGLAQYFGTLKGIKVTKGFVESDRLSNLDTCLRNYGVPWPGNLDGFFWDEKNKQCLGVIEFSRTRKNPVETHNINTYFHEDKNRWRPLLILQKNLDSELIIIIWKTKSRYIKIHRVQEMGASKLIFKEDWKQLPIKKIVDFYHWNAQQILMEKT